MMGGEKKNVALIPWMRNPVDITQFQDCPLKILPGLDPKLAEALNKMNISSLFPVQLAVWQETIGPGAFERDLCVNSPTGSGKTLAYALPIVQMFSKRAVKCLRVLVVLPTRDLAIQVKDVFDAIAPAVGLSVGLAVGQSSIADEIAALIRRPKYEAGICYDPDDCSRKLESLVDILVATPGRLMDHISTTKGFSLEHLQYLVVDETDRLLRESYQSWLPNVLKLAQSSHAISFPYGNASLDSSFSSLKTIRRFGIERGFRDKPFPRLVKMVLSATLTQDPGKLSLLDLHHPLFVTSGQRRYHLPITLQSYKLICAVQNKPLYLVSLLEHLRGEKCIVFTSSRESTHRLCKLLNFFDDLKIKIKKYSGLQHQTVRSKTLKSFRKGDAQVLICSDGMTRGMDVEGVSNVINYDMPPYIKTYVHRVGRTARAGQVGRCFTLLRKEDVKRFTKMLEKAGNADCSSYSLSADLIQSFHDGYVSALEKLKEDVTQKTSGKRKLNFKSTRPGKRPAKN